MSVDAASIAAQAKRVKDRLGRREVLGWVMHRVEEEVGWVMAEVIGALLEARVEEMLGRGWREGIASRELVEEGEVECRRCGARARGMFWRNGHRGRTLVTPRGEVRVPMPMLKCRCCAAAGRWEHG